MDKHRANFLINVYQRHFKEIIDYKEAVAVAQEAAKTLKHLPHDDPARGYFTRTAKSYFELAEAISVVKGLTERAHLKAINCIVSYDKGGVTKQEVVWVNQCVQRHDILRTVRRLYLARLAGEGVNGQLYRDLEIVLDC